MFAPLWLAATAPRWGVLHPGSAGAFVCLLIFAIIVYAMIQSARAGNPLRTIHKLPGLDAMDEAIGRATEMGRPTLFVMGIGDIRDQMTITSYPVLAHVATQCARYDTRLINPNYDPLVYAVNSAIVQESYLEAGRPDAFNPEDVRFLTNDQFGFAGGVLMLMEHERPAATILYGDFYAESMLLVEAGGLVDSVEIGATANISQIPFFMAGCDYTLIAEEMYAASAYLSKEPVLTGTIIGEDIYKFLMVIVIIVGALWASLASGPVPFTTFFKM
jgi:hypothetical protein